ncbi:MAG: glycosyltransferase family 9 protein, partial [Planctomycetota bacterium]
MDDAGHLRTDRMLRLLIMCPNWVGDAVMATPALRHIRDCLPGVFIGGFMRPGIDQVLDGAGLFDEIHVERAGGVMGPKFAAAKLRPRNYDTALLLTNSFRTALTARIAGIRRRVGYDRDGRGLLLTHKLTPPTRPGFRIGQARFAPWPAVHAYWHMATALLDPESPQHELPADCGPRLGTTERDEQQAEALLSDIGTDRFAVLVPGGSKPAKRWPAERFGQLAQHATDAHGLSVLASGSPAEAGVLSAVANAGPARPITPPSLGALKAIIRRASLVVSNDTGPRHIAIAFGVPTVSLFGPTDHRWTIVPGASEQIILADPAFIEGLPEDET